jgi:hypothetical protein
MLVYIQVAVCLDDQRPQCPPATRIVLRCWALFHTHPSKLPQLPQDFAHLTRFYFRLKGNFLQCEECLISPGKVSGFCSWHACCFHLPPVIRAALDSPHSSASLPRRSPGIPACIHPPASASEREHHHACGRGQSHTPTHDPSSPDAAGYNCHRSATIFLFGAVSSALLSFPHARSVLLSCDSRSIPLV